jgi:hypothetical protein
MAEAEYKEFTIYREDFNKLISIAQLFLETSFQNNLEGFREDTYETLAAKDLISLVELAQEDDLSRVILEDNEVVFLSKLS